MDIDLKNINVSDIKEKLKAIDKKTLINFDINYLIYIHFYLWLFSFYLWMLNL